MNHVLETENAGLLELKGHFCCCGVLQFASSFCWIVAYSVVGSCVSEFKVLFVGVIYGLYQLVNVLSFLALFGIHYKFTIRGMVRKAVCWLAVFVVCRGLVIFEKHAVTF